MEENKEQCTTTNTPKNPLIIQLWSEGGYGNLEHPEIVFGKGARGTAQLCRRGINIFLNGVDLSNPIIKDYIDMYIKRSTKQFLQSVECPDKYDSLQFDTYHLNENDSRSYGIFAYHLRNSSMPYCNIQDYTIQSAGECTNVFFNGKGDSCLYCERFNPASKMIGKFMKLGNMINDTANDMRKIETEYAQRIDKEIDKK
jgi:hypothetical protein